MQYCSYTPSSLLSKYIKCYWTLEDDCEMQVANRERIFPDGSMELVFHYGDLFKKYDDKAGVFIQPRSFLHGQIKRFIDLEPTGRVGVFSVRFLPGGAYAFLRSDMDELAERSISLEDLWGVDGLTLEEKMLGARSTSLRIHVIEEFFLRLLKTYDRSQNAIDHCVNLILNSESSIPVESLSEEVNLGRRQLERKFTASVGLSPKLFTRIIRFQRTLQLIENASANSLTSVAYAHGFYDQSHFTKDFKEFTGLNPRQYFKTDLQFAKFLALF
ncbi:MAG TPA: helix-turn-helix domain-containing protein [Chryseolinea sp.]